MFTFVAFFVFNAIEKDVYFKFYRFSTVLLNAIAMSIMFFFFILIALDLYLLVVTFFTMRKYSKSSDTSESNKCEFGNRYDDGDVLSPFCRKLVDDQKGQ